ncbi:zinc finger protein [Saccharopolyspora griseoalba]|uniref:Zinc finger protein n=1 Tax=Saccharopolyspora griseoalba TaxID=1431848 RepID=A0ABW2LS68_9PSEU
MPANLTYVWRPITGGRHAFPIDTTWLEADEEATAYCGAVTVADNLHHTTELAWIMEPTCTDCWQHVAAKLMG